MKILYISQAELPSSSAYSIHVMKMCQAFANQGHDVRLIVPKGKNRHQIAVEDIYAFYGVRKCFKVEYVPWPKVGKAGRLWSWEVIKFALNYNADLIYTRYLPAALFAAEAGFQVIYEEHQLKKTYYYKLFKFAPRRAFWWSTYLRPFFLYYQARFLFSISKSYKNRLKSLEDYKELIKNRGFAKEIVLIKRLARHHRLILFVVISHALERDISKLLPALANKILVAPDGADIPRKENLHRINIDKTKGKLQVGYCGHLYPGKGMEIIEELLPLCPWACFHIVGGTEREIRKWRKKLRRHKNIIFYGHVQPSHTSAYIMHFDVCLLPNQPHVLTYANKKNVDIGAYTSPLKMFEYMALGKPIVASDLPVLREILKHEYNALLCPHNNALIWSNTLQRLLNDPKLRMDLGRQALADFINKYTWDSRAKRILQGIFNKGL